MEIRQLRYFVAVSDDLHFRRAAARLGIAQPFLSRQISQLEDELGAPLFYRSRRDVRLSPEGQVLLARARDILARVQESTEAVRRARQGKIGTLEIAYSPALEIRVLPRVLRLFRRRYPSVAARLFPQTSAEQHENLRNRRIDAGFMLVPPRDDGSLEATSIAKDRLVLVAPADHPLGRCPGTPLAKLEGEPFVGLSRTIAPEFHDHVISATRSAGVTLRIAAEAKSIHEALSLAASGLGVTLLPSAVRDIPWRGVSYCPVDPVVPRLDVIVAARRDEQSGLVRNFLGVVRELFKVA